MNTRMARGAIMMKATVLITLILSLVAGVSSYSEAQSTASLLIKWNPNPEPDIARYIIYRSLDQNLDFTAIDSVSSGTTSYIDDGVTKGTRYYYRLVAKNSSGDRSPFSNPVSGLIIGQDADIAVKNLCRVTNIDSVSSGRYNIDWSTETQTIGFVQYDFNWPLDSLSAWDDDQYSLTHAVNISGLYPRKYYLRAVAFDNAKNMTVSSYDSLVWSGGALAPLTAPEVSIYPVPFNPGMNRALTLANLPEGGSIAIFNERGLNVWGGSVPGSPMLWNGTNWQGAPVASGVYLVVIKDARGSVVEKRSIMILN